MVTEACGAGGRRILVTGGSGFIGTNLVEHYRVHGVPVLNLDVSSPRNPAHHESWLEVDVRDLVALTTALREFAPTQVFHMAARTDLLGRKVADYRVNYEGVANVLQAAVACQTVERIIVASTRMVNQIGYQPVDEFDYDPPNAYGESKVSAERVVRRSGSAVPWVIIRPTSLWGPWFGVPYKDFFLSIHRGRYFHVRQREVQKSFGFIGNSIYQLEKLLAADAAAFDRKTLYLGDYPPIEVRDWATRIQAAMKAPPIREVPYAVAKIAAAAGDVAKSLGWTAAPLTSFRLANMLTEMVYDLTSLEEIAGPLPYLLEDAIHETVTWLRAVGEIR